MILEIFSEVNKHRCESDKGFNHKLDSWSLSDWMTATMGELGEAANVVKKMNRIRDGVPGNKETPEELKQRLGTELADVFIYLNLTMQAAGFDPEEIVRETFNKKSDELDMPFRMGFGHIR